ncbi:MAG: sterol desaturase family protein [Proteobacteria bacterium]|nr:sterol desaturase family protein [Pseudomonadota bacterium]
MSLRKNLRAELEAPEELRRFGSGWIAGVLGFALALGALFLVFILRQPALLGMPELSALHSQSLLKPILFATMIAAFFCGTLSLTLRDKKLLGTLTIVITLVASLWGAMPQIGDLTGGHRVFFGLDFFIINVIFGGVLFIPLERIFPHRAEQPVFRGEWREDLFYYFISSMLVQVLTFTTLAPSTALVATGSFNDLRQWVGGLPFVIQIIAIMALTDFVQYWVHRAFHRVPFLWKFHAVHHSAKSMDWIAGARMHFLEIIVLRAATATPAFVLGFTESALQTYLLIVYVYSTFVHANLNWNLGIFERFLVTPRFHHWHHGLEKEAIDVNFAIHFPLYDRLFGTYHMPEDRWPKGYGIGGHPVPTGYWQQFLYPFRRTK